MSQALHTLDFQNEKSEDEGWIDLEACHLFHQ
jgi:hypothetical protein